MLHGQDAGQDRPSTTRLGGGFAAGAMHVRSQVYHWGDVARLGLPFGNPARSGSTDSRPGGPRLLDLDLSAGPAIVKVCSGSGSIAAFLTVKGQLALLRGNVDDGQRPVTMVKSWGSIAPGLAVHEFAIGYEAGIALDQHGVVHLWGRLPPNLSHASPGVIFDADPVLQVACSDRHAALVAASGALYTFGSATGGALGHNSETDDLAAPARVLALHDYHVRSVSCGGTFTAAIVAGDTERDATKVFTWGIGCNGRLGHDDLDSRWVPTQVSALDRASITSISCGDAHCLALSALGQVFTWGDPRHGRLGRPPAQHGAPMPIDTNGARIVQVSAGYDHSAMLSSSGALYMFGSNRRRQLGVPGVHVATPVPVQVAGLEVDQVHCARYHTMVIVHEAGGSTFVIGPGTPRAVSRDAKRNATAPEDLPVPRPEIRVTDRRHERMGLPSRADFYNHVVLNDMLSSALGGSFN
ncbi:unnamed protein product (mitochondrion) [Plasmodiophora brassicae]|uniref:RCC1-like domain-containing protein n=2 Tax=Plasmodiophora brassicae TaxID=37360 RepID=A0A3P3Y7I8_PLABS|nr:unnamed protein product [Plasmodiophora brassicae]